MSDEVVEVEEEYSYVLNPGAIVGGFRIIRPLGHGGCGEVHEAVHTGTERRVALKILLPEHARNSAGLQRFRNEGLFMGRVRNAGEDSQAFPEVYGSGEQIIQVGEETLKVFFLALEFFDGTVLENALAEAPGFRLEPKRAIGLLVQALGAMSVMHGLGIVHRDLKPDNLMLVKNKVGVETVKVLDLGIARAHDVESKTQTGAIIGTPHYMSPEQCDGRTKVDHRTDLYAAGVILFECLAGFKPYERNSLPELLSVISCAEPTELPADVDPGLKAVVLKAIAKKPEERFQSAREFREALLCADPSTRGHALTVSDGTPKAATEEPNKPAPTPPPVVAARPAPAVTLGELRPVTMDTHPEQRAPRRTTLVVAATAMAVMVVTLVIVISGSSHKPPTRVATAAPTTQIAPPPTPVTPVNETAPVPVVAAPAPTPTLVSEPPTPRRLADNGRRRSSHRHRDDNDTPAVVTRPASCRRVHVSDETDGTPVYEWRPRGCTP